MRDFMVFGDFTISGDLSNGELLDCTTSTGFMLYPTRWGETFYQHVTEEHQHRRCLGFPKTFPISGGLTGEIFTKHRFEIQETGDEYDTHPWAIYVTPASQSPSCVRSGSVGSPEFAAGCRRSAQL